jgi:hypothetical protein
MAAEEVLGHSLVELIELQIIPTLQQLKPLFGDIAPQ